MEFLHTYAIIDISNKVIAYFNKLTDCVEFKDFLEKKNKYNTYKIFKFVL